LYTFLISSMRAICLSHSILLYFITLTIFGEVCNRWSSSLYGLLQLPAISSLLGPQRPVLKCPQSMSSFSKRNHISHLYIKTTDKIMILYILSSSL
jgi:hypothetical protein